MYIPKIVQWDAKGGFTVHVFMTNDLVEPHNDLLKKIEVSTEPSKIKVTKKEETAVIKTFGEDWKSALGIYASSVTINQSTVHGTLKYHSHKYPPFQHDDTIQRITEKAVYYLTHSKESQSINDYYFWYDTHITTPMKRSFVHNLFRSNVGDGQIPFATFLQQVKLFFGSEAAKMMEKETLNRVCIHEAMQLVNDIPEGTNTISRPLSFHYMLGKSMFHFPAHPWSELFTNGEYVHSEVATVTAHDNMLINSIETDTISMVSKQTLMKRKHPVLSDPSVFFPRTRHLAFTEEDKEILQEYEKRETTLHTIQTEELLDIQYQSHVNYFTTKLVDTCKELSAVSTSREMITRMTAIFDALAATREIPFIKLKTRDNIYVKVHKETLPSISSETLDKLTAVTTSSAKKDFMYILCKVGDHAIVFINQDMTIHIRANYSIKEKVTIDDFFNALKGPLENNIFHTIQSLYPHVYIPPFHPQQFENTLLENKEIFGTAITSTAMLQLPANIGKNAMNPHRLREMLNSYLSDYFVLLQDGIGEEENGTDKSQIPSMYIQFKKINHYTKRSNVDAFLSAHIAAGASKDRVIKSLMKHYQMLKMDAENVYLRWEQMEDADKAGLLGNQKLQIGQYGMASSLFGIDFVGIKIRMISQYDIKLMISGLMDVYTHDRILHLIKLWFSLSNSNKRKKAVAIADAAENAAVVIAPMAFDIPDNMEQAKNAEEDKEDMPVDILMDEDFGEEDLDADLLALEEEFKQEEAVAAPAEAPVAPEAVPEAAPEVAPVEAPAEKARGKIKGQILSKLHEADPYLFDYKPKDQKRRRTYSSLCGWVDRRQPVVVNKTELEAIEQNHKGAIYGHVRTGSTKDKASNNYYICPSIWCPKSRTALTVDEYLKNKKTCPLEGEEAIKFTSKSYWGEGEKGMERPHYPGFLDKYTHPDHMCLPCCFKKEMSKKKKQDQCDTGLNENADDAQKDVEAEVTDATKDKYIKGEYYIPLETGRYGLAPHKLTSAIGLDKCGIRHDGTGIMMDTPNCLLRKGISQSKQSFLDAIVHVMDREDIRTPEHLISYIVEHITIQDFLSLENGRILKLFVDDTKSIYNKKHYQDFRNAFFKEKKYIHKLFLEYLVNDLDEHPDAFDYDTFKHPEEILREFLIFMSFANFKKYLHDDAIVKTHDIMWDLVSKEFLNTQGVEIMILSNEGVSTGERILVHCHTNRNNYFVDTIRPYCILLLQNGYYEPLHYIHPERGENLYLYMNQTMPEKLKKVIKKYHQQCAVNITQPTSSESLIIYLSSIGYKPKLVVIDYGYKACGVIVKDNLYIPFIDRENTFFHKNIKYTYLHEVPRYKCFLAPETVAEIYRNIGIYMNNTAFYQITSSPFYNGKEEDVAPVSKITEEGFFIRGNTRTPAFIPLRLKKENTKRIYFNMGLFLFTQDEREDKRSYILQEMVSNSQYLEMLYTELNKYIATPNKTKSGIALSTEIAFLTSNKNPLPLSYRRRKLFDILQPIMKELVKKNPVPSSKKDVKKYLQHVMRKITDIKLGHIHGLSTYIIDRLHHFHVSEEEAVFDLYDIGYGKLTQLRNYMAEPYSFYLEEITAMQKDYIQEPEQKPERDRNNNAVPIVEEGPLPEQAGHSYTQEMISTAIAAKHIKIPPVKYRTIMPDFKILQVPGAEFHPHTLYHIFVDTASITLLNQRAAPRITMEILKATIQNEMIEKMTSAGNDKYVEEILSNPYIQEKHKAIRKDQNRNRAEEPLLQDVILAFEDPLYYPSSFDLKIMASLCNVNLVIIGRKTQRNIDGIEIIDNNSLYYIIFQYSYDRVRKIDRYDLYFQEKTQRAIYIRQDFSDEFMKLVEHKKKTIQQL